MWFLEHTKLKSLEKYKGHIPRYLNWNLSKSWRRTSFQIALIDVAASLVQDKSLKYLKPEGCLKENGFVASSYLDILQDEKKVKRAMTRPIYKVLVEMTPVYMKFGIINPLLTSHFSSSKHGTSGLFRENFSTS